MADEIILNNFSDDSQIKKYINSQLIPRVFHNIPLNVLNTGMFSIINEYMSQGLEKQAFTSSFYFNESFITKAVLPDSIYSEAAIFDIGYSYATPSSCYFLLELKLSDIFKNAKMNVDTGLYEFILDKNTKFNLENGNVYSLDYDILIQYKNVETASDTASIPAWNVQYINTDDLNSVATNKNTYIVYRVTSTWLCLVVQVNEYERNTYTVINNMANGIANADEVITCNNHICGFDVKYIDNSGNEEWIPHDHILPIHSDVKDTKPYIHYIMDDPQTIRFMFQLNGSKYFVPSINSSYEITVYTCHGEAANFTAWDNESAQPSVIADSSRYPNNANVLKAGFVLAGGSVGGCNIGTVESVRRETIEAYNTVNVLSTDHDINEWFKTFYFKNILYPFFFKRRDDPWGKIWSGYLALKDSDDYVFRTNTLHARIGYDLLYKNNDNTVTSNEIIIPPGWVWVYNKDPKYKYSVKPYTKSDDDTIENAKTLSSISDKFAFANPFGIRIQKDPFAIGYFNPWIDEFVTVTRKNRNVSNDNRDDDLSVVYHATPVVTEVKRVYRDDFYTIKTNILPSIDTWVDGSDIVHYLKQNATAPLFVASMWNYFNKPLDMFTPSIPILPLQKEDGYLPFNPNTTYFCVETKNQIDKDNWQLNNIWIDDSTSSETKRVYLPITGEISRLVGSDKIWGVNGLCKDYSVYATGVTDVTIYPNDITSKNIEFGRVQSQNYYRMALTDSATTGTISKVVISSAMLSTKTGYDELSLYQIGNKYSTVYINIYFADGSNETVTINNAAVVYTPYECVMNEGEYEFDMSNVSGGGVILYAEMKPSPEAGSIEYYRVPLSIIEKNVPLFYIENNLLPSVKNNMRVILHAYINGVESGNVEMLPVTREDDGSYLYEADMYPLNEMVDVDNRIKIASINNGGGSWKTNGANSVVTIDATNPEFRITILIRSTDTERESEIDNDSSYTGFRIVDEYKIDDFALIQELKEMRSVVNFGDSSIPTEDQMIVYNNMMNLNQYDATLDNIYTIYKYAYDRINEVDSIFTQKPFSDIVSIADNMKKVFSEYMVDYNNAMSNTKDIESFNEIYKTLVDISTNTSKDGNTVDWVSVEKILGEYDIDISDAFESVNVSGAVEIQLVPFVEHSLMLSDRFESFVRSFTNVHKSLEPIIFDRLEGNNYLDCKLIATYGLPHTYCADRDVENDNIFWPDLNIQIEFDVKLYNQSLATNTINELKVIIKSYFNRLTSIHTPVDLVSLDNNIYISKLIQQLSGHENVAYLKFKGFYTDEKNIPNGSYMDANVQSIVMKWKKLEDFPKGELERFVPEMFVMDDDNIVINNLL